MSHLCSSFCYAYAMALEPLHAHGQLVAVAILAAAQAWLACPVCVAMRQTSSVAACQLFLSRFYHVPSLVFLVIYLVCLFDSSLYMVQASYIAVFSSELFVHFVSLSLWFDVVHVSSFSNHWYNTSVVKFRSCFIKCTRTSSFCVLVCMYMYMQALHVGAMPVYRDC